MTTSRNFEKALQQANRLEAEARFWELADEGIWSFFAGMNFSPDFCHRHFTHRAHLPLAQFKKLLREAKIEFVRPAQQRDRKLPSQKTAKRYRFRGKLVTLEEALAMTGSTMSVEALRLRVKKAGNLEESLCR
ncbi:hypothetical protein [Roseibacillus ishigakijimensis]|uniref:Uncharacterized protein n=1 Tax=Roseibacillus ishigakijimensis TaxID=454146 RepID=A0A934RU17_9BACT|nr:hypothetical protein [Roseibacillus ishigakijimensis]MBK1835029.1 hypothetical protein [Roseibacillus ishigakijimensis]